MNPNTRRLALLGLIVAPLLAIAQSEAPPADSTASETTPTPAPVEAATTEPAAPAAPVTPPAAEPELSPLPATSATEPPAAATVEKAKDTLSVDFPDEDVRNILRNVSDLFELNIVMPDTLQGRTSIKLRDVTWRQIFDVVLEPVGYTFIEEGNIIKIVTNDSLNQEPLATEVFILNYARAEEIKPSVDVLVGVGGRVQVDKRINALIIIERPSVLKKITPVIQNLDRATDQVMIESKFIEVNDTNVKNLGINWASLNNYQVGYSPIDLKVGPGNRSGQGINTGGVTPGTDPVEAGVSYGAVLTAPQFNVALRALQTVNDSRVVSNPTIVTLNNTAAEINVGEEYPIPNYTYNAEQGQFEISGFEYKPIGVLLKVTPQVNSQGFIRLSLEPEISVRAPDPVSFGGASAVEIPIIRTRKTKTQVSMKDGHTLAIGGLLDSTSGKNTSRVPVLGSIPGLGRLFRSNTDDMSKRNLLIFITSKVISSEAAPVQDIFSAEQIRDAELRQSDLPGRRSAEPAFLPEKEEAPADAK
jgi:type IV pilus assembly protein PilQ